MSSTPWNRSSKGENNIETFILTQDKNLRCIAILTSKTMIAFRGISLSIQKKMLKCCHWEDPIELPEKYQLCLFGKFSFAPISKSLLFELFSDATSVCQCYMDMWNILQSNLTTLMDNLIKPKQ